MAADQNYYVDVSETQGEETYEAILRSIPKPPNPIPAGTKFTRITITKLVGLPREETPTIIPETYLD